MSELIDGLYQETVELVRDDGVRLPATRITPEFETAETCNGAGVLVVAGEWGLGPDDHVRLVQALARLGYFVVAMDLVRGRRIETVEDAYARATGLDHDIAIDDISAGLLCLKELASGRIGVIGLDIAATIAIEAATVLPHIDAVVHIGGSSPSGRAHLSRVRATILVHRAERGDRMTAAAFAELGARMKRSRATLLEHTYPTDNDSFFIRPRDEDERYHARVAWDRTRDFLTVLE